MTRRTTVLEGDALVSFNNDAGTHVKVSLRLLEWFHSLGIYSGEGIMQSDRARQEAPEILSEIAEDLYEFGVKYKVL